MALYRKRTAGKPSKKWWGRYRDHLDIVRRVPLAADKQAAAAMLSELVRRAERQAAGIVEPTDQHLRRPRARCPVRCGARGHAIAVQSPPRRRRDQHNLIHSEQIQQFL